MAGCSPVACQGSFAMATSNHGANSINQSLADQEALLGGLRFWVSVIKASRRARNSASGTAPCALKGNKFAEQRFGTHCGPIDGSGDIGGSLTPQIGDRRCTIRINWSGGEQAIPKARDLHGARWLFDLGSG